MTEQRLRDPRLAVVVLAAGGGTRMRSKRPKVLHPLGGRPMIAHVLGVAEALGPAHVVAVVRHERDLVAPVISELHPDAVIADQDDIPGTGRAAELGVAALPNGFDGEVLVVSGDTPLLDATHLAALVAAHREAAASATLLTAVLADATGYGRVVRGADGLVERIVEHRDATDDERGIGEINSGTYVFSATALRPRFGRLGTGNAQGERYLTDVIGLLRGDGERVWAMQADDPEIVSGVNDRVQLAQAARVLNARIVRRWQLEGVSVLDPQTTWIDADVVLAPDVELLPNTFLTGATVVATGAVIGPDTTLRDCEVGEDAHVTRTDATLAVVGAGATVGPWSYLRAGTELGAGGKIGTFVETKNARIGDGSKVPHLSYIGDTTVGEGSNIGAGTITANYDGVHKHATQIGSHVRTASHNVFVAPVRIGDGAYTGAGTVVRKDVPAGALAVNVAPQRNMEGWVEQRRPGTPAADAAARASESDSDR